METATASQAITKHGTHPYDNRRAPCRKDPIILPESFNYIGIFLTLRCPYHCSYCINRIGRDEHGKIYELSGKQWINFFQNLETHDVPITLQGGEPGSHRDFIEIVRETLAFHKIDILSNLAFDLNKFVNSIDPEMLNRPAPYAPIRVSFHPEQFSLDQIISKILFLQSHGFRVGIYGITHPAQEQIIIDAQKKCLDLGIDFRLKPFLGEYQGKWYGEYAYPGSCNSETPKSCKCAGSELLVAPDGSVYRCHHHLYNQVDPAGNILSKALTIDTQFHDCKWFGNCNPCDVKVKNNRFQQFGHVSVQIRLPTDQQ